MRCRGEETAFFQDDAALEGALHQILAGARDRRRIVLQEAPVSDDPAYLDEAELAELYAWWDAMLDAEEDGVEAMLEARREDPC